MSRARVATRGTVNRLLRRLLLRISISVTSVPLTNYFQLGTIRRQRARIRLTEHVRNVYGVEDVTVLVRMVTVITRGANGSLALLLRVKSVRQTSLSSSNLQRHEVSRLLTVFQRVRVDRKVRSPRVSRVRLVDRLNFLQVTLNGRFMVCLTVRVTRLIRLVLDRLYSRLQVRVLRRLEF